MFPLSASTPEISVIDFLIFFISKLLDNSTVKHIQFSTNSSVLVGLIQPLSRPTFIQLP